MDNNSPNLEQAQEHANNLQSQINDLRDKAQSSSDDEKQGYMAKIEELKQKKDSVMAKVNDWESKGGDIKNKAEGLFGK